MERIRTPTAALGLVVLVASCGGDSPTSTGESVIPGVTNTWTGLADGTTWGTPGNWSATRVPLPQDTALLAGPDTVVVTGDVEVTALTAGPGSAVSLTVDDVTLTVGTAITVGAGAELTVRGDFLTVEEGTLDISGATVSNQGTLRLVVDSVRAPTDYTNSGVLYLLGANWHGASLTNAPAGQLWLGGNGTIEADLTNLGEAHIHSGDIVVTGDVVATEPILRWTLGTGFAPGWLRMTGDGVTLEGTAAVKIEGAVSLSGPAYMGDLTIEEAGAELTIAGHSLEVLGDLHVMDGTHLTMTDPLDEVTVSGVTLIDSDASGGHFTAGTLRPGYAFSVQSADGFVADGTHTTVFDGGSAFVYLEDPTVSHFRNLTFATSGNVTLSSDAVVQETLTVDAGVGTVMGGGHRLVAGELNVAGGTFQRVLLEVAAAGVATQITLDDATFVGYDPSDTQLSIAHPGGAAYTFTGLTFDPLLDADPGYYVSATDSSPDGAFLSISVADDPGNGPLRTEVSGTDLPSVVW